MTENIINSLDEFLDFVNSCRGAVVYFSTPDCNVCKVLKPKLKEMLKESFSEMKFAYVDTARSRELAAQHSIFTVPTILFYFEGKESIRKSRNVNLSLLKEELQRIYFMVFG